MTTPATQTMPDTGQSLGQIGHHASDRYIELPVEGIADVFRCTWVSHVGADDISPPIRVIPDNCADFIVTDDGRSWFVGPATRVELPDIPPGTVVRGLRVQPHALRSVINAEPAELVDRRTGFDDLLASRAARTLEDALLTGRLDHRLLQQLWPRFTMDERTTRGIHLLASQTDRPVEEIAWECAMSPRQFRRIVRQVSGLSPKTLQRVSRLQRVLAIARYRPESSLSTIAASAGYADQAHLARDARKLAELTPQQLVGLYR